MSQLICLPLQENDPPEFIDKFLIPERHRHLLWKAVPRTGEWEPISGFQQKEAHVKVVMNMELI